MTQVKKNTKLFGTDGIRGTANTFPILPEVILKVGQALGHILNQNHSKKNKIVLIGKDTRISGYMLEQALASGLNSMGIWVQLTGPLPSPGIGFLAQNMRVDSGVIISASHNPYQDNGIKIFDSNGSKISIELEQQIEQLVFSDQLQMNPSKEIGRTRRINDATGRYIVFVKRTFPNHLTLEGFKIVLDCAHGASYKVAPAIFSELGAEVIVIGNKPNGFNINENCGAVYPQTIQKAVLEHKAHLGISLDGDGDRLVMIDEKGQILTGNHILGILSVHLKKTASLKKVVSTQMANMGLENLLNQNGMQLIRVNVGDKNVSRKMKAEGIILGGEPSGHIILSQHSDTGDACIAALNILALLVEKNKKLSELREVLKEVPQVIQHVSVEKKTPLEEISGYTNLIKSIENKLKDKGRCYVRFSGTEPLARIMIEGEEIQTLQNCAQEISLFLQKHLN